MRYRSELGAFATGKHIVYIDGVKTVDDTITGGRSFSRTCEDVVIPMFKSRQAAGEIFNNPFNSGSSTYVSTGNYHGETVRKSDGKVMAVAQWTNGALLTHLVNTGVLTFPSVTLDTSNAVKAAQISAIGGVNKTSFDAGTFAGEWYKTKRLHRDVGNALLKVFTEKEGYRTRPRRFKREIMFDDRGMAVIKKNGRPGYRYFRQADTTSFSSSSQKTKDLGNAYLVGRYGVAPLLYDLDNARKFLTHLFEDRHTSRGSQSVQNQSSSFKMIGDTLGTSYRVNLSTTETWQYSPGLLYVPSPVMSAVAQLGLLRPLSTVWELTPYSFVVDWFWQVGAWLDAMQPSGAAKISCAWESTRQTTVYAADVSETVTGSDATSTFTGSWHAGLIYQVRTHVRNPWIATVPKSPAFGTGFTNPLRSIDIAALVLQKFRMRQHNFNNHVKNL